MPKIWICKTCYPDSKEYKTIGNITRHIFLEHIIVVQELPLYVWSAIGNLMLNKFFDLWKFTIRLKGYEKKCQQ